MARLSRHTFVVLLVALVACAGGMSIAVVAFGQSSGDPDPGVPTGDFTGTTPAAVTTAQSTSTLGTYTTTTPTTTPTVTTTPAKTHTVSSQGPKSSKGTSPVHGASNVTPVVPSKATRTGPTHLAFTGGEPIGIGLTGFGLMLAGLALMARRRRPTE